jgi:hypothetical protein
MRPRPFCLTDASKTEIELTLNELRVLPNWGNGRDADTFFKMLVEQRDNRRVAETEAGTIVARDVEFDILPQDVEMARSEFFASRKPQAKRQKLGADLASPGIAQPSTSCESLQFPNEISISIHASIDPSSKRLRVRDVKLGDFSASAGSNGLSDHHDDSGPAELPAALATKTQSIYMARHRGGGGEAVGGCGADEDAAAPELDASKMKRLKDQLQKIGAIQSNEPGAEQHKTREKERLRTFIRRLESMDVEEAEEELDRELRKQDIMYVERSVVLPSLPILLSFL